MTHPLESFHNLHKGKRLFIIGAGPSLNFLDLRMFNKLQDEYTFGVNYLLRWSGIKFHPQFWAVDEWPDLWNVDEHLCLHKATPTKFYSHSFELKNIPDGWVYVNGDDNMDMEKGDFAGLDSRLEPTAAHSGSVTMFALQVGCWMGFDPIYLIGCDATREGHCYPEPAFAQRQRQDVYQRAALTAYKRMAEVGRVLIDLTEGGMLPIKKAKLRDILG